MNHRNYINESNSIEANEPHLLQKSQLHALYHHGIRILHSMFNPLCKNTNIKHC